MADERYAGIHSTRKLIRLIRTDLDTKINDADLVELSDEEVEALWEDAMNGTSVEEDQPSE